MAFYKGTHAGIKGLYNRIVRLWTRGRYSHVEVVFSDGICGSASFVDGGVRYKRIGFDPSKWDFVELPAELEPLARRYFDDHNGEGYDVMGNVRFLIGFLPDSRRRKFCSEAAAEAIGLEDGWRFEPNTLFQVATRIRCLPSPSMAAVPVVAAS